MPNADDRVPWLPHDQRDKPPPVPKALHDGIPTWLEESIRIWFVNASRPGQYEDNSRWANLDRRLRLAADGITKSTISDRMTRRDPHGYSNEAFDETFTLRVVDALLLDVDEGQAEELESMLVEGGSAWAVRPSPAIGHEYGHCLERRLHEAISASLDAVIATSSAGGHLAKARHAVYGQSPDPSVGYAEAVRAVEMVINPLVIPNDHMATLGKAIPALRQQPAASKWSTVFRPSKPPLISPVDTLVAMCELLWTGHHDRHAKPTATPVTQMEAEAAVMLAMTIVAWIDAGVLVPEP